VLYRARRYEEAIVRLNRALELEPGMGWLVYSRLGDVYEQMGQYDRALTALGRAGEQDAPPIPRQARVFARMGNRTEATRLLRVAEADPSRFHQYEIASAYVALGDRDRAFTLLFDQLERGDPGPNFVAVDPPFDSLHTDPRWAELLRRMNVATTMHERSR
jgi:tetratricopeptide (TPR) repeat protein